MLNVLLSPSPNSSGRSSANVPAIRSPPLGGRANGAGGHHILGYDVDAKGCKLVVNADEAARVRAIFALYLEHEGLVPVVQELKRRGWTTKRWTTRKGQVRGGKPFTKTTLHKLLTNVTYSGQVRYKTELHDGEQPAIIDADVWQRVQVVLQRNGRNGGAAVRNQFGALLKGLLRCVPCGCAMTPAHSTKKGKTLSLLYSAARPRRTAGTLARPSRFPPAKSSNSSSSKSAASAMTQCLRHETFAVASTQAQTRVNELTAERRRLERDLEHWHADIRTLVAPGVPNASTPDLTRLADMQERIRLAEQRLTAIKGEIGQLSAGQLHEDEIARALSVFEPLWESLTSREQAELLHLLVERVDFDGARRQGVDHVPRRGHQDFGRRIRGATTGEKRMSQPLTIERTVHFRCQAHGRRRLEAGPAPEPVVRETGRVPRVSRLMALALRLDDRLRRGDLANYGDVAELGHVTRRACHKS